MKLEKTDFIFILGENCDICKVAIKRSNCIKNVANENGTLSCSNSYPVNVHFEIGQHFNTAYS